MAFLLSSATIVQAQSDIVQGELKISDIEGTPLTFSLDDFDRFGQSVTSIGDLDGDGIPDLAVGAPLDDDGGRNAGAVYVLFMNADGTVDRHQKISPLEGDFSGVLETDDVFGASVAALGDINGDSVPDIAVGAPGTDDGGNNHGAVWILLLKSDGKVLEQFKISETEGSPDAFTLDFNDEFGTSVTSMGDLDEDGVIDLAVGAYQDGAEMG